ncbi:MAG: hypothetical protein CBB68_02605 [Rhodospirillaceae bacterium TMED8]|nr:enoyl-CoA hydratase [Magnetovibrio sp.]OUT52265.1 MAG: hypothetical protein CBB68_02605 [Rhodospirillaceae bacterium TMED8]|tara:strand:+ start:246 stop:1064 length:819 start_codon:yes stop_codon:yes gene_type:complete
MTFSLSSDAIRFSQVEGIATVRFNRPESLNSLNYELISALNKVTDAIKCDQSIRVVVIEGEGKHFMAGGDVKSFNDKLESEPDQKARGKFFNNLINELHVSITNLRTMGQPVIGKVHGAVAGAGVSFMLACDLVVAADDTFFTLAYCHLGTSPDGGSTFALPRVTGIKTAMEIALLGDRFNAAQAQRWGLVNRVVSLEKLDTEVENIAKHIARGPMFAYAQTKALLNQSLENDLTTQLAAETKALVECAMTNDFQEGVDAFVSKRKPEFKGT